MSRRVRGLVLTGADCLALLEVVRHGMRGVPAISPLLRALLDDVQAEAARFAAELRTEQQTRRSRRSSGTTDPPDVATQISSGCVPPGGIEEGVRWGAHNFIDVHTASQRLNYSESYVRRLLREGRLAGDRRCNKGPWRISAVAVDLLTTQRIAINGDNDDISDAA